MHNMCSFCGSELEKPYECKKTQENENGLKLDGVDRGLFCKFCGEKQEHEMMEDNMLAPTSSLISPTVSLKSSDSSVSSCSEFSVDVNSYGRASQVDGTPRCGQDDPTQKLDEQLHRSSTMMESNLQESNNSDSSNRHSVGDVDIRHSSDNQEAREIGVERTCTSSNEEMEMSNLSAYEMNTEIWVPPEADDSDDDMEGSVANYDDEDDEFGDGTKWGKPSSLSSFREEGSGSYRFKDEKQKAMEEIINGKFKALVSQLLKHFGVASSGKDGENWLDIVTSLSWEAASFVKPDAIIDGKAMDPDGCVKVKCIATGSRSQSQVIKGLVFKKHAAHKHMPTKCKNPRLLLIRGMLGQSSSGLSSFDSMEQEKNYLKSIIEMIETCHPNVVLVEKTVSRDVLECILAKGITLVYDMKLHRLERVARYTGSPIISSDTLMNQKLKHCDYFRIEKFTEELTTVGEGGKRPSKTLMFLEGCPTRLGCTILLKGSDSNELKRIKCVVQCAVNMAYHLILETSFLVDLKAMFSTIPFSGIEHVFPTTDEMQLIGSCNSSVSCLEKSTAKSVSSCATVDIPISSGFHEGEPHTIHLKLEDHATLSYEPYKPAFLSGLSALSDSVKLADGIPLVSSTSYHSLSSYFGLNGKNNDSHILTTLPVLTSTKSIDHCDMEAKGSSDEEKPLDTERPKSLPTCCEAPLDTGKAGCCNGDQVHDKDGINAILDSQSILVLMSSRNAFRGTICEQSHFSHIKFYRNFDVPLGKFLRDNILNQRQTCSTCGELPEAHFYYYAHHNKQLTIRVKRIPEEKHLPGEAERKLWMWSLCGKCKAAKGNSKSTKRVLISTAARGLSFGKFLELSFSHHSTSSRLSSCGHTLQHFFGLGPMVAMFSYSSVATYTVSVPPQILEFNNSVKQEWIVKEIENVYMKGMLLFTEIDNSLQKIQPKFKGSTLKLCGSLKEFSDIEEMVKQERSEFEANIQNAFVKNLNHGVCKFLRLNRLLWELLLQSCIWDRRLHLLVSTDPTSIESTTADKAVQDQSSNDTADGGIKGLGVILDTSDNLLDDDASEKIKVDTCAEADEFPIKEIPISDLLQPSMDQGDSSNISTLAEEIVRPAVGSLNSNLSPDHDSLVGPNFSASVDEKLQENFPSGDLPADRNILVSSEIGDSCSVVSLQESKAQTPPASTISNIENSEGWVWTPFRELKQGYMKSLQEGFLPTFKSVSSYTPEHLPSVYQLISEEGSKLHIPLGNDDYIASDYEGEISSVIACALALLKDLPVPTEYYDEDTRREKGLAAKTTDGSHSLTRIASINSPRWSTTGSSDSDGLLFSSVSLEESRLSSFDGLNLLDSLVSFARLHPEVSLGEAKLPGKGKYSVVCLYAGKFRDLRNRCCPSEHDYIASLSRCRNWDAKGGKSKAVFAKTLDDRFIIKEIKKTETESFMKFAPDYFQYMNQSYDLGNQTCLAKILGIYQVVVRQAKSGKEMKHDLMVMENLSFGRNISRRYDLKGALHARFNSASDGSGDVLLDQNFVNDMNASPLYVSNSAKRVLQRAVYNDTTFLNSINVMDYSLLVGVDTKQRKLVCGIIDYLRQYTWDKQLETWVKSSLVVPKNLLPTVISPKEYKKRFRKFMSTHFLSVPDSWCSQRFSNPCELCDGKNEESSKSKSDKQGEQHGFSF